MIRKKTTSDLEPWMADAGTSLLASFACGIRPGSHRRQSIDCRALVKWPDRGADHKTQAGETSNVRPWKTRPSAGPAGPAKPCPVGDVHWIREGQRGSRGDRGAFGHGRCRGIESRHWRQPVTQRLPCDRAQKNGAGDGERHLHIRNGEKCRRSKPRSAAICAKASPRAINRHVCTVPRGLA